MPSTIDHSSRHPSGPLCSLHSSGAVLNPLGFSVPSFLTPYFVFLVLRFHPQDPARATTSTIHIPPREPYSPGPLLGFLVKRASRQITEVQRPKGLHYYLLVLLLQHVDGRTMLQGSVHRRTRIVLVFYASTVAEELLRGNKQLTSLAC